MSDLEEFLCRHGIEATSQVFQELKKYGVTEVAHISEYLEEADLLKAGN